MKGTDPKTQYATGDCPTGKRAFPARKNAKAAAASVRSGNGEHLRPYRCQDCGMWHIGHLPLDVLRGRTSSADYYQRESS